MESGSWRELDELESIVKFWDWEIGKLMWSQIVTTSKSSKSQFVTLKK